MKYEIKQTEQFSKWLKDLKDKTTVARILSRIYRVEQGNFGDSKQVAERLFELRFFFGSGYRVYYTIQNNQIVLLLCGGDKTSQSHDIETAQQLLKSLENNNGSK